MKIRSKFMEVACCRYCLEEVRSRGERILEGECIGEGRCDWCDEVDDLVECVWEVE